MTPNPLFSQILLIALVLICLMIYVWWLDSSKATPTRPYKPDQPRRKRSKELCSIYPYSDYGFRYKKCKFERFCRKFSFEAICGMVSPPTHAAKEERDDGDQLQRGSFPTRHYSDGRPLVCRLPFEHAPRRRTGIVSWPNLLS